MDCDYQHRWYYFSVSNRICTICGLEQIEVDDKWVDRDKISENDCNHNWNQYSNHCRVCSRCGLEQILTPNGDWIEYEIARQERLQQEKSNWAKEFGEQFGFDMVLIFSSNSLTSETGYTIWSDNKERSKVMQKIGEAIFDKFNKGEV